MKTNPWFRLYTEMVDDEKLRLLAFEDRWHYVALLCCKGKGMLDSGDSQPLLLRKISVKLGLTQRETETVLMRLSEVDLVDPETAQPLGWDDRQFVSDTSTERVRTFRERMKRKGNVSETAQETETEADIQKKSLKAIRPSASQPSQAFENAWSLYPKRAGTNSKADALKAWNARLVQGESVEAMTAGVQRYAAYIRVTGKERTEYVKQAASFFGPSKHYLGDYAPPAQPIAAQSAPSKGMQAIMQMEEMKSGRLDSGRNSGGLPAVGVLGLGAPAGAGPDAWDSYGLGRGSQPESGVGSGNGWPALPGRVLDHDG